MEAVEARGDAGSRAASRAEQAARRADELRQRRHELELRVPLTAETLTRALRRAEESARRAEDALNVPRRIEIHEETVHLILDKSDCAGLQGRLSQDERIEDDLTDPKSIRLIAAIRIRNRRGRTEIRSTSIRTARKDPILIGALQRAHAMVELDTRHLPFCRTSPDTQYGRRLIRLAFLAPDLQKSILDGTQPADLTLDHLLTKPVPCDWDAQRRRFEHI